MVSRSRTVTQLSAVMPLASSPTVSKSTVARREKGGNNWYVGSTVDENGHTARFSLDFLEPGKKYIATIYADAPDAHYKDNPQAYTIRKYIVTNKTRIVQPCAPGGGFAMSIEEATDPATLKGLKNYKP